MPRRRAWLLVAIAAYYRRVLPKRGWRLLEGAVGSRYFSFRKGDADLHVLAGGGVVDLEVDHVYCEDESFGCAAL